jgi:hypothetical protein
LATDRGPLLADRSAPERELGARSVGEIASMGADS